MTLKDLLGTLDSDQEVKLCVKPTKRITTSADDCDYIRTSCYTLRAMLGGLIALTGQESVKEIKTEQADKVCIDVWLESV
jgi:hypothetical protein